jgi:hypothetical protein
MKSLTAHERILATVHGEPVDRTPVFAPLPFTPLSPEPAAGDWKAEPAYRRLTELARAHCDFFAQLEIPERQPFRNTRGSYGMHGVPEGIFDRRFLLVPPECVEMRGQSWQDGRLVSQYAVSVPGGELTATEGVNPGEDTVWELEPLVKSVDDAERLLAVPHRFDPPDMTGYFAARERLGGQGVAVIFVSSPLVMVSRLVGFQRLLEWSVSEPAVIDSLIEAAANRVGERLRYVLAHGAGPIIRFGGCEQATPPMMSARMFDRYILGYERPLWHIARDAGAVVWVHCHGRVRTVIDKFAASGVQMLDPVEPPPQGDIELAAARERVNGRLTLIGNIEWSDLEQREPDEIEALVERALRDGGPDHYILAASAEIISAPALRLTANVERFILTAARCARL